MLNKDNYVPWSSRLFCYAKSKPNGKLIYNSILHGPYVRRMVPKPDKEVKQIEADDQAIQTILLGLPEDIYAAEKKAKLFNEWEMFTSTDGESIESYYHHFSKLKNDFKRNKHFYRFTNPPRMGILRPENSILLHRIIDSALTILTYI
ncbi:hypothetical protein Tco_0645955 [Tanacetum coccineum]